MKDQVREALAKRLHGVERFEHAAVGVLFASNEVVLGLVGVVDAEVEMEAHRGRLTESFLQRVDGAFGVLPVRRQIDVGDTVAPRGREKNVGQVAAQKGFAAPDEEVVNLAQRGKSFLELVQLKVAIRFGVQLVPVVAVNAFFVATGGDVERDEWRRDAPPKGGFQLRPQQMGQERGLLGRRVCRRCHRI